MRRDSLFLAGGALLAMGAMTWAGCYQLSSDCGLLLSCGGAGGAGGAGATSSTSGPSSSSGGTTSTTSTTTSSTVTTGTGGAGTGGSGKDAGPVCDVDAGTETDVGCGGPGCPPCAQGKKCHVTGDCVAGATCVESVCCGSSACPVCSSCALPGKEGSCTALPAGTDQPMMCESAAICSAGGACVLASTDAGVKGAFRAPCTQGSDCFNGVCQAGVCKLALGDACGSDAACGSGRCAGNVCAACATGTDCVSVHCNAGVCALGGGDPCTANADCAGQLCDTSHFCVEDGSQACTAADCIDHFCNAGSCESCSVASDCPLGSPCNGGSCLAPPGAFCNQSSECASGNCAPAALLDFKRCQ